MFGRIAVVFVGMIGLLYSVYTCPAYAYLDPGTGSYLFQILIAGLVGGLFAVKIFWGRIKIFLSRIFNRKQTNNSGEDIPTPGSDKDRDHGLEK